MAAEWAGFETVGQCEWADYPTKVLEKHWPDVPRWRDIRSVTAESFYKKTGLRTVKLISGGFPCQPFSVAGERKGEGDDRYLWPEMCRVIKELQPDWVVGENVLGIVSMALDQVLSDMEDMGYTTQTIIIPACSVNALHRRDRTIIIANTSSERSQRCNVEGYREIKKVSSEKEFPKCDFDNRQSIWDKSVSELLRVHNGISNRMDRFKSLGNAVVPQQVYPILQAIADIESEVLHECHT